MIGNDERGGKGSRAVNIGGFKPYKVRTKIEKWGEKRKENLNGWQRFPNWRAKIITGGSLVGSLHVGLDQ